MRPQHLKAIGPKARDRIEVRRSTIHGRGLFAKRPIPADTLLGEYLGEPIYHHRGVFIGDWTMQVDHPDGRIELRNAKHGGNALRFINYAKDPNTRVHGFLFYAKRDIGVGEEITWDYGGAWD